MLIGLWDLLIHSMVLCALIFMFRQPMIPSRMMPVEDQDLPMTALERPMVEPATNILEHNQNFVSSKVLLNRILERRNRTHAQPMSLNTRNFYSHLDLMTIKWAASLNRRRTNLYRLKFISKIFFSFFRR